MLFAAGYSCAANFPMAVSLQGWLPTVAPMWQGFDGRPGFWDDSPSVAYGATSPYTGEAFATGRKQGKRGGGAVCPHLSSVFSCKMQSIHYESRLEESLPRAFPRFGAGKCCARNGLRPKARPHLLCKTPFLPPKLLSHSRLAISLVKWQDERGKKGCEQKAATASKPLALLLVHNPPPATREPPESPTARRKIPPKKFSGGSERATDEARMPGSA